MRSVLSSATVVAIAISASLAWGHPQTHPTLSASSSTITESQPTGQSNQGLTCSNGQRCAFISPLGGVDSLGGPQPPPPSGNSKDAILIPKLGGNLLNPKGNPPVTPPPVSPGPPPSTGNPSPSTNNGNSPAPASDGQGGLPPNCNPPGKCPFISPLGGVDGLGGPQNPPAAGLAPQQPGTLAVPSPPPGSSPSPPSSPPSGSSGTPSSPPPAQNPPPNGLPPSAPTNNPPNSAPAVTTPPSPKDAGNIPGQTINPINGVVPPPTINNPSPSSPTTSPPVPVSNGLDLGQASFVHGIQDKDGDGHPGLEPIVVNPITGTNTPLVPSPSSTTTGQPSNSPPNAHAVDGVDLAPGTFIHNLPNTDGTPPLSLQPNAVDPLTGGTFPSSPPSISQGGSDGILANDHIILGGAGRAAMQDKQGNSNIINAGHSGSSGSSINTYNSPYYHRGGRHGGQSSWNSMRMGRGKYNQPNYQGYRYKYASSYPSSHRFIHDENDYGTSHYGRDQQDIDWWVDWVEYKRQPYQAQRRYYHRR